MVKDTGRRRPRKSLTSAEALKKVESTAYRLGISWHLRPKEIKQISTAFSLLNHPSTSTSHQKYLLFLQEVRRACGLQGVCLCAAALGHNNVRDMNNGQRNALVRQLGEGKCLSSINNLSFPGFVSDAQAEGLVEDTSQCSAFEVAASPPRSFTGNSESTSPIAVTRNLTGLGGRIIYNVDDNIQDERANPTNSSHLGSLEVEEYPEPSLDCQENLPLNNRGGFSQEDWQVGTDQTNAQEIFEHASLEGTATVFRGLISGAIRIRTESSPNSAETYSRASVTTVFPPWGGPVDCLLSLDLCESRVQSLAMALFKARVKWAENSLHVSFESGANMTIPNSEVTLKGVEDEAIAPVFGSEIQQAIRESPIRLREMAEGRLMTECVSMIITEKSAIVNLSLGLIRGLEIQKKLYT